MKSYVIQMLLFSSVCERIFLFLAIWRYSLSVPCDTASHWAFFIFSAVAGEPLRTSKEGPECFSSRLTFIALTPTLVWTATLGLGPCNHSAPQ